MSCRLWAEKMNFAELFRCAFGLVAPLFLGDIDEHHRAVRYCQQAMQTAKARVAAAETQTMQPAMARERQQILIAAQIDASKSAAPTAIDGNCIKHLASFFTLLCMVDVDALSGPSPFCPEDLWLLLVKLVNFICRRSVLKCHKLYWASNSQLFLILLLHCIFCGLIVDAG